MATPINPRDLIARAKRGSDPANETDLRRAVSDAYYAVFHTLATAAADMVVGADNQATRQYELAYRSVEHARIKKLAEQMKGSTPASRVAPYLPSAGYVAIAGIVRNADALRRDRQLADYDPCFSLDAGDVADKIALAETCIADCNSLSPEHRAALLALLLFEPRSD